MLIQSKRYKYLYEANHNHYVLKIYSESGVIQLTELQITFRISDTTFNLNNVHCFSFAHIYKTLNSFTPPFDDLRLDLIHLE